MAGFAHPRGFAPLWVYFFGWFALASFESFCSSNASSVFAFAAFFFFENFLYISVYMADARAQVLPLVTVGDPEMGGHDWFQIFAQLGLLRQDRAIAAVVNAVGWLGMLATMGWLAIRYQRSAN